MNDSKNMMTVNVLGRDFQVRCEPENQHGLEEAARFFNQQVKEIKASGKVIDYDRIVVMAALNLAYDLMTCEQKHNQVLEQIQGRLQNLQTKMAAALTHKLDEAEEILS